MVLELNNNLVALLRTASAVAVSSFVRLFTPQGGINSVRLRHSIVAVNSETASYINNQFDEA